MTITRNQPSDGAVGRSPASPSWSEELTRLRRGNDPDAFVAPGSGARGERLFGGLVAARALAAAGRCVDAAKHPQSLHLYFLAPGAPDVDIDLRVDRTREGRSFATRRVVASQGGTEILEMLASFHTPESGHDQHPPAPADTALESARAVPMPDALSQNFEVRTNATGPEAAFRGPPYWIRTSRPVADDALTRACVLTYISDMGLMAASRPPDIGTPFDSSDGRWARRVIGAASLDHAIWFHRPFLPDQWHCYSATHLNSNDARGLAHGAFHDAEGVLIASTAQEALWRVAD